MNPIEGWRTEVSGSACMRHAPRERAQLATPAGDHDRIHRRTQRSSRSRRRFAYAPRAISHAPSEARVPL